MINLDIELKTLNGEAIKENEKVIMVKDICANALLSTEEKMEGRVKLENWNLAQKVYKGGDVDLTPEEIVKIRELVGKNYTTLIVGQIYDIVK